MNHFIKLPDGTIINVAHVRRVAVEDDYTLIDFGNTVEQEQDWPCTYHDPQDKIYEYFNSIAQEIGEAS